MLENLIEKTLGGLSLELVDIERTAAGLLRIVIEVAPENGQYRPVTLDDCERASRQLERVFMVENVDYDRLEVSSPGLDRVLKKVSDFERFAGMPAKVRLKRAVEGTQGRKNFEGVILPPENGELALEYETKDKDTNLVVFFTLEDLDKAHLVPQVNFRRPKA